MSTGGVDAQRAMMKSRNATLPVREIRIRNTIYSTLALTPLKVSMLE
jgi:hypothetical protein